MNLWTDTWGIQVKFHALWTWDVFEESGHGVLSGWGELKAGYDIEKENPATASKYSGPFSSF